MIPPLVDDRLRQFVRALSVRGPPVPVPSRPVPVSSCRAPNLKQGIYLFGDDGLWDVCASSLSGGPPAPVPSRPVPVPSRRAQGLSPGRCFTEIIILLLRPRLSRLLSPSRRVLSPSRRVAPRVSPLVDASRKFFFFSVLGCPASCPRPVASRPGSLPW